MTNKTDKNSNKTRAGTPSKIDERTSTDTNQLSKYEGVFNIGPFGHVLFLIEATSKDEAKRKAEAMRVKLLKRPDLCNGSVSVESVRLIRGGQSHE